MEMVELFNAVTLHTSPESLQHIGTLLSPHYTRNVGLQGSQRFWGEVRRYFRYTREPEVEAQKMSLPSWQDLRKLKIFIAFGPAVPLINIYPRKTFIHEHQKLWFVHFPFVMRVDLMLTVLTTTTSQKTRKLWGHCICLLPWLWWWYHLCLYMFKLSKLYTSNIWRIQWDPSLKLYFSEAVKKFL